MTLRAAHYFGGKGGAISQWIGSNLPHHTTYIEPFGGLASVLLNKPVCDREVYNELNEATVNFIEWVKWDVDGLIRSIDFYLQYWGEKEHQDWLKKNPEKPATPHDRDAAAHFYLHCETSFMGGGLRYSSGLSPSAKKPDPSHLVAVARRLKNVDMVKFDAIELIRSSDRDPDVCFYIDPPYLNAARKSKDNRVKQQSKSMSRRQYAYELSEVQHIELRLALEGLSAIVSGYKSGLYDELYQGWEVRSKKWQNDTEYLWISPEAMAKMPQLELLGAIAQ